MRPTANATALKGGPGELVQRCEDARPLPQTVGGSVTSHRSSAVIDCIGVSAESNGCHRAQFVSLLSGSPARRTCTARTRHPSALACAPSGPDR